MPKDFDTFHKYRGPFVIDGVIKKGAGSIFAFEAGEICMIAKDAETLSRFLADLGTPHSKSKFLPLAFAQASDIQGLN